MFYSKLLSLTVLATCSLLAACGGGSAADLGAGSPGGGADVGEGNQTAALRWSAASDARVKGYRVYYGTRSGQYLQQRGAGLDAGVSTEYLVAGLATGATYYFAVTGYDDAGNESDYSAEASKTLR